MTCYYPNRGFKDTVTGGWRKTLTHATDTPMDVPCGGCIGCRLDRAADDANRIIQEASLYENNRFITLTYRDWKIKQSDWWKTYAFQDPMDDNCTDVHWKRGYYLPADHSLNKKHFQNFMKRLRGRFPGRRIRYYHCGEYGGDDSNLGRPHYHAALFDFQFPGEELLHNYERGALFRSELLEELWPYGYSSIGQLTPQSAAYIARYCVKKITGVRAHQHYLREDEYGNQYWLQPEYATRSLKPGLGAAFYEKFESDILPRDTLPVPGKGLVTKVPRYYEKLYERRHGAEALEQVKLKRREYRDAHQEEYTRSRLDQKLKVKQAQLGMLPRAL